MMKTEMNWLDPSMVLPGPSQGPVLVEWHEPNGRYGHCFSKFVQGCNTWQDIPPGARVAGWALIEPMDDAPF